MIKNADPIALIAQHIRRDYRHFSPDQTVEQALAALRQDPPLDRIIYFYVVDDGGRLLGVVPTRQLLLSARERRVGEIMITRVITLRETATVQEACELFALHRFLAFPVIDSEKHLLGVVDIQLYTDELDALSDAQARNNFFQSLGVYSEGRGWNSPLRAFASRFPWLGSNLVGGLICAVLASAFQDELGRAVALALFIPVVLNLAESVSSQSVTLTLHVLQGRQPNLRFIVGGLRRELATGLLLGLACGAVVGLAALLWLKETHVALSLLGGISCGVAVSAMIGLTLPVILRVFELDPKVAAGPIALAASDVATLFAYLSIARWFLAK